MIKGRYLGRDTHKPTAGYAKVMSIKQPRGIMYAMMPLQDFYTLALLAQV